MDYDPIKDSLGRFFSASPLLQRVFYALLHLFFLRSWHVKKELRRLFGQMAGQSTINVLDAGTGFGQYAYFMAKESPQTHILAVDVKQDYLDNAHRFFTRTSYKDRIELAYEDLTDLKADGPFDLILSVDVMEHIEDDRAVFRHFARVLNPGGHVIINTPSDLGGSDVQGDEDASFIGEHVRDGYNMEELKQKLADSGLQTVRARYTYGKYGSIAWRVLIKWPMVLLSKSRLFVFLLPFYYVPVLPVGLLLNAMDVRTDNPAGTGLVVVARKEA